MAIEDDAGDELIAVHGPRRFLGEIGHADRPGVVRHRRRGEPRRACSVPIDALRDVVAGDAGARRPDRARLPLRGAILIGHGAGLAIVGIALLAGHPPAARFRRPATASRTAGSTSRRTRTRSAAARSWASPRGDADRHLARRRSCATRATPSWPRRSACARRVPSRQRGDLVVVGAGPAGLAASVYGASEGLDTVTARRGGDRRPGRHRRGSRTTSASPPASPAPSWPTAPWSRRGKFGARDQRPGRGDRARQRGGDHVVRARRRHGGRAAHRDRRDRRPLPAAAGAAARGVRGHEHLLRRDASRRRLCAGDPVAVVGGGNSAGQAALFLSRPRRASALIVREDELEENMSRYLADRILRNPRIELRLHTEVRELSGDRRLEAVVVEDRQRASGARSRRATLFVFIGAEPHTGWLGDELERDAGGYVADRPEVARADGAARRCCWRPAGPGCSPSATCAAARSSGWRQPSARARWPCAWSTSTWRTARARARAGAARPAQTKVSST